MSRSVGEWLAGDSTDERPRPGPPKTPEPIAEDGASSAVAIALCLTTPVIRSWTPRQREVFRTLSRLQLDEGVHSLLPGVMDAFVWIARQPWWDTDMAGILDEHD